MGEPRPFLVESDDVIEWRDIEARMTNPKWRCDWQPDEFQPAEDGCPYCAGMMCARFDGIMPGCQHDIVERHGYA